MNVEVKVGILTANADLVVARITIQSISDELYSVVTSDLTFTPCITIAGNSISTVQPDLVLLGVKAA